MDKYVLYTFSDAGRAKTGIVPIIEEICLSKCSLGDTHREQRHSKKVLENITVANIESADIAGAIEKAERTIKSRHPLTMDYAALMCLPEGGSIPEIVHHFINGGVACISGANVTILPAWTV